MAFCYSYLRASKFLKTHLSQHSLRASPEQLRCHSSPISPPTSQVGWSLHRHFFCSSEHGWRAESAPRRPTSSPFSFSLPPPPSFFLRGLNCFVSDVMFNLRKWYYRHGKQLSGCFQSVPCYKVQPVKNPIHFLALSS